MSMPRPAPGPHRAAPLSRTAWAKECKARQNKLAASLMDFAHAAAASAPAILREPLTPGQWLAMEAEDRARHIRQKARAEVETIMPPRPAAMIDPRQRRNVEPTPVPESFDEALDDESVEPGSELFRPGSLVLACASCGTFFQVYTARSRLAHCGPCRAATS
jgi:hypothetical protein